MLKKLRNLNLFYRFFLIISGVAITPILLVTAYLIHYQEVSKENTMEFHEQLAGFSANIVTDYLSALNRRMSFAQDLERAAAVGEMEEFKVLQQTLITNPDFAVLSVLNPDGMETVKLADTKFSDEINPVDRSKDASFKRVADSGLVDLSPVHLLEGEPVVTVVYPLATGGFAYLDVDLIGLWKRLDSTVIGKTGHVVIVDKEGRVLPGFSTSGREVKPAVLKGLLQEDEGSADSIPSSGGVLVGGYHAVPAAKWYVLTLQPQDEAFLAASKMKVQIFFFVLLIAITASAVAYFVAGKIVAPLLDLTRWALRVAKNDYSKSVAEPGWGELNTLARTCNQMMKDLKTYSELQIDRILEEKSKVETLVTTIPDGLVMANFKGELMYLNGPAMTVLGVDEAKKAASRGVFDVIHTGKLKKAVEAALAKEEKVEDVEVEVEEPGTTDKKYFKTKASIVTTPEKKDVGVLLIMHDVTFEKQMEKMKEGFFHSVAHDLRAPIFGVQGYLHLLEKRIKPLPTSVEKGYFNAMYASCDKLIALVKDILDVAQLESGSVKIDASTVDVNAFLVKVHTQFVPVAIDRGLEMKLDLPQGDHGKLVCDERLTDRVLSNLISNALKFTPAPGSVTLHLLKAEADTVTFEVSDTGPGVPPNKIGSLFGKFVQIDGPQKSQGFGLGLSICKTVVELHGGKIWVESEGIPGKGCHFKINQPRTPPPENLKAPPASAAGPGASVAGQPVLPAPPAAAGASR